MSFAKLLVLVLSLTAATSALITPHVVRHPSHHRALAARAALPAVDIPALPLRKRQNTRRCKQRSSSVQAPASTVHSSSVAPTTKQLVASTTTKATPTPTPTTTTTKEAAPTTTKEATTTPKPTTTHTTTTAKATTTESTSNLPSFMVGTQTGQGTFYATGLGACGITNTDTDFIAAASHLLFDNFPGYNGVNPNDNPMCGKKVTATYQGKTVTVTLTDRCTGCAVTDLDFSPSAFNTLSDPSVGRISGMTWVWDD